MHACWAAKRILQLLIFNQFSWLALLNLHQASSIDVLNQYQ
jgi:hypothetical protein